MNTQSNPSPFSTDVKTDNTPANLPAQQLPKTEFVMRTMKEDLAKIQASGIIVEKKVNAAPIHEPTKVSQPPKPEPETKKFNPAEVSSEKVSISPEKPFLPAEDKIEEKLVEVTTNNSSSKNKPFAIKILIVFIFILVIAIIGLGAYYFSLNKKNNPGANPTSDEIETPIVEDETDATEQDLESETPEVSFSEDKPNYLPIDINNLDASEIKLAVKEIADELKDTAMQRPYEFIIVDDNNNPISFPIFATAAKINFSQELLASLGNNFSFYLYNDNSSMRSGLNIEVKDNDALAKALTNQEPTFISDASFLFLNGDNEINNGVFATSSYGKYQIRYSNTATKDLSIDYSIVDSRFTLGTSKNTERAIIDQVSNNELDASLTKNCDGLAANLLSCTPYVCESIIKQEIKGIIDGKCNFVQYLPNNYKTNCNFTKDMQEKVALSLKEFQETGNSSFSISSNLIETEVKSEINGKENAMQEALTLGQCVVDNK